MVPITLIDEQHIGKKAQWVSSGTPKVGIVRAFNSAWSSSAYDDLIAKGVPENRIKFQRQSISDRVIIEVPRTHKKTGEALPSFWYAPRISQEFFWADS